MNLQERLESVNERIAAAAQRSGRKREDITLVAVTKTYPPDIINEAIKLGVRDIGENKVQEVMNKYDAVDSVEGLNWHLIGHLQTNKVKYIIGKTKLIHSVDSIKLMDEIERKALEKGVVQDILIQVNISGEQTKFGINPDDTERYMEYAESLKAVRIRGLMTIAPKLKENQTNMLHFCNINRKFIDIRAKNYHNSSMDYLSMGMSGDFEDAIECGSNMVRVGSAIFGERKYI